VTVHWPDGGEPEAFGPFTAGATHVLVRGQGDGQVPGAQK